MKTNKTKVLANALLLVLIMAVVMLPAVSSGIMKINKDDRVLSITDERPETPAKPTIKPTNKNVKTIIIKEIPEKKAPAQGQIELMDNVETSESTNSESTDSELEL